MNKPTPEDYAVDVHKTLEINAKATGSEYYITSDNPHGEVIINAEDNLCLEVCAYGLSEEEREATLQAIAHNHNVISGLCRRLIELEEAVIALYEANESDALDSEITEFFRKHDLIGLGKLICQAREAKRQECEQ